MAVALLANALCTSVLAADDAGVVPHDSLILWLDASNAGTSPLDRGPSDLTTWVDRSGLGNDFQQEHAERSPQWIADGIGGRPAVRFNGVSSLERTGFSGLGSGDQTFHIALVMRGRMAEPLTAQRLLDIQSRAPGASEAAQRHGFWVGFQQSRGIPRLGIAHGDEGEALSPVWDDRPHLLEFVYSGEQGFEIYVDGRRERQAMFNGTHFLGFEREVSVSLGQHARGTGNDSTWLSGDLGEVLIYSRPLSEPERHALGTALTTKYGLATEFAPLPLFERDVAPILAAHCHDCHGQETQESGLDLRTVSSMLQGSRAGPVIVRGHPEFSELVTQLKSGKMPPEGEDPLTPEEIQLVRNWIEADAAADEVVELSRPPSKVTDADRSHWAWQKLGAVTPPAAEGQVLVRNDVDRFVLARLATNGLSFSVDASPERLLRRVWLDLTGQPPSPAEADEFLNDTSEDRYERLITRLLDSQHFGERWGRHWLDVVGYVDVHGSDNDAAIIKELPGKWRYRDYVIRSFNDDKPFNRFLLEQLAGDELYDWRSADEFTPEMLEALIATGFLLSANDDTSQNELNTPDIRHHVLQRTAENVAGSLLALTMQCAKCHDHKYEALSQFDYYRFEAAFAPVFNIRDWVTAEKRTRPDVSDRARSVIDQRNRDIDDRLAAIAGRESEIRDGVRQKLIAANLEQLPEDVRSQLRSAIDTPEDQRSDDQRQLLATHAGLVNVSDEAVNNSLSDEESRELAELAAERGTLESDRQSYGTICFATAEATSPATHVLRRGNYLRPGLEVDPELFEILCSPGEPLVLSDNGGRRLALARALTDSTSLAGQHVARVFVNRIWQQLFGKGIVETSDNFGVSGAAPTHPALLDWLTLRFIEGGWRVKPLIRTILLSATYRQTSTLDPTNSRGAEVDPDNRLLWRMNLRRLDSEQVRDSILTVSGKLDRTLGGPPVPLDPRPDGMVVIKTDGLPTPTTQWRRSVYILARRNYHMTLMRVFDQPIVARNCAYRQHSAVVTQSLALLNDDFVIEQAGYLADRSAAEAPDRTPFARIRTAWRIALGRFPDETELQWCLEFLERGTLNQLCHMLLNTNEFLYVP